MTRIIREVEPSLPWTWMAILTKSTTEAKLTSVSGDALKQASSWASLLQKVMAGDISAFIWGSMGGFGEDVSFGKLIQSVQLPSTGFTLDYTDLGFVRYPSPSQIISEPLNLEFLETADSLVSRYFSDWVNEIAPVVVDINKGTGVANDTGQIPLNASSLFAPLDSVARSLFIIKTRRDLALGLMDLLAGMANKTALGNFVQLSTGFYELPTQIYCFPKVVPQKVTEAKLDKSETNSTRTLQVVLERVPTLVVPGVAGADRAAFTTSLQLFLSATMGWANVVSTLTSTLIGYVQTAYSIYSTVDRVSKLYTKESAAALTDLSKQPGPKLATVSASPVFSLAGGIFTTDQSVSLSSPDTGASIYYTVDGADPTTDSTKYAEPLAVAADGTIRIIKAMAATPKLANSPVKSETYTIRYPDRE